MKNLSMKARTLLVAALVLAMLAGVSCYAESIPEPEWPAFTDEVTITWWNWLSAPDKVIEGFNEVYPNIHVDAPLVGSGTELYNKMVTAMQAGSGAPDVMQVEYQYMPQFIDAGYLVDISQYVGGCEEYFVPWTWAQCSRGDAVYSLPQDVGPNAFLYRPDVFEKYGLTVPTTYEEMAEQAAKLHEANPEMYFTYFPTSDPGKVTSFLWQSGARPFHYDVESGKWSVLGIRIRITFLRKTIVMKTVKTAFICERNDSTTPRTGAFIVGIVWKTMQAPPCFWKVRPRALIFRKTCSSADRSASNFAMRYRI